MSSIVRSVRGPAAAIVVVLACSGPRLAGAQEENGAASGAAQPEAPAGEPISLSDALRLAEQHAPEVLSADKEVGLGRAAVEGAGILSPFNPEVDGLIDTSVAGGGFERYEVDLTQRLEIAGQRGLRIDAAKKLEKTLRARAGAARWEVLQEVRRLFRLALLSEQRVALEQGIAEFADRLRRIAQQRFDAGEEPVTSVLVAKAEHAQALQRLMSARVRYSRWRHRLSAEIGWTRSEPPRPVGDLPEPRSTPPMERLVESALTQDPVLAVLRANRKQRRAQRALEKRLIWPNPAIGVSVEREELTSPGGGTTTVLGFLSIPLPLWNRNQGGIARSEAEVRIADQEIANRRKVLAVRVHERAEAVNGLAEQAQVYQSAVLPTFKKQLGLLQSAYELGELSLLDVMTARDRLLGIQRQSLDVYEDYVQALSELEKLLGASMR